jgi:hypothetical protein
MIDSLTVGSVTLHETSNRSVAKLDGWVGAPGVRGEVIDRPENDGSVEPIAQYRPARIGVVEGETWGASIDATITDFGVISAAFEAGMSADLLVLWTPGGSARRLQGNARLAGPVLSSFDGNDMGAFLRYQAQLRFSDPRWYSQTQQSATVGPSTTSGGIPFVVPFPVPFSQGASGGSVSVTNSGTIETWPTIVINGPINGPAVGNASSGDFLYFDSLNLSSSQTLTIVTNPQGRGALVAGASVAGSLRWSGSSFPSASPGVNTFQFYPQSGGTAVGTSMTVSWRDAYLA